MIVWTTPLLKNLVIDYDFPLKLVPEKEIGKAFLEHASLNDIGLIYMNSGHAELLSSVRLKGLAGPIIFIAKEPESVHENLFKHNAILFDLKKTGVFEVKEAVNFILKLLFEKFPASSDSSAAAKKPILPLKVQDDRPVEDSASIIGVLQYMQSSGVHVIVSLQIPEETQLVTTRGTCKIRTITDPGFYLHEFRPSLLLKAFRESSMVKTVLASKDINYEANLKVLKITDKEILLSLPDRLFLERRKYLRIEPSLKDPIRLYLLMQDDPTIYFKVSDISQRGIGFICSRDLGMGTTYSFTIILPDPTQVVVCYGTIKFKKEIGGMFMYGAELQIHPKDEETIAQYIMKREVEISELLQTM